MAIFDSPVTTTGSSITLGTPVPPGSTGSLDYFLYWRVRGSINYNVWYAKVDAGVVKTRQQLSARNIEYFVRAIDSLGAIFDTALATMHLLQSTQAYTYTELQSPGQAKIGETVKSTAFSFQLLRGAMVPGSVANPARDVIAPLGGSMTHTKTNKLFTSGSVALVTDAGLRHHDFAFGV
jgi:hypothetical protein